MKHNLFITSPMAVGGQSVGAPTWHGPQGAAEQIDFLGASTSARASLFLLLPELFPASDHKSLRAAYTYDTKVLHPIVEPN